MSKFVKNFITVLKEDDLERQAMESSLDDGINPEDFDTNLNVSPEEAKKVDKVLDSFSQKNQEIRSELEGWLREVQSFLYFLNSSKNPNSIQTRLSSAEENTIMGKVRQAQQTKIARVAADLAGLEQALEGYMGQSANAKFKYVAIPLSFGLSMLGMISQVGQFFC